MRDEEAPVSRAILTVSFLASVIASANAVCRKAMTGGESVFCVPVSDGADWSAESKLFAAGGEAGGSSLCRRVLCLPLQVLHVNLEWQTLYLWFRLRQLVQPP